MEDLEVQQCEQCGVIKDKHSFFSYKNENYYDKTPPKRMKICKDCIKYKFDYDNPDTFLWVLKELNTPYIKYEWERLKERYPNSFILPRYLAKMRLRGFWNYTYADSEELNAWHEQQEKEYQYRRTLKMLQELEKSSSVGQK